MREDVVRKEAVVVLHLAGYVALGAVEEAGAEEEREWVVQGDEGFFCEAFGSGGSEAQQRMDHAVNVRSRYQTDEGAQRALAHTSTHTLSLFALLTHSLWVEQWQFGTGTATGDVEERLPGCGCLALLRASLLMTLLFPPSSLGSRNDVFAIDPLELLCAARRRTRGAEGDEDAVGADGAELARLLCGRGGVVAEQLLKVDDVLLHGDRSVRIGPCDRGRGGVGATHDGMDGREIARGSQST